MGFETIRRIHSFQIQKKLEINLCLEKSRKKGFAIIYY